MEYVYLQGSEDVKRAGYEMSDAAEKMTRAASMVDESLRLHRLFLDDWLERYRAALETK